MSQIHIQIVMPDAVKLDDKVDSVFVPGVEGDFEILPGHISFITKLREGVLHTSKSIEHTKNKELAYFAMHDGFISVEDDYILVLSENCENQKEINIERATKAKEKAEKRLAEANKDNSVDYARAEAALLRAITRLNTVKGL